MEWLKLHCSLLDNVRFHKLNPLTSKVLIMMWIHVAKEKKFGKCKNEIEDMAFIFRVSPDDLKSSLAELEKERFIEIDTDFITVCKWEDYQTLSSTERAKKSRMKAKEFTENATLCNNSQQVATTCNTLQLQETRQDKTRQEEMRKEETRQEETAGKVKVPPDCSTKVICQRYKNAFSKEITFHERVKLLEKIMSGEIEPKLFLDAIEQAKRQNSDPRSVNYIYTIYNEMKEKSGEQS